MAYIRLFLISFMTGFGVGLGFWIAHLLCKKIFKNRRENKIN
jgi:hypothetical protein